jgi:TolA-binding protein
MSFKMGHPMTRSIAVIALAAAALASGCASSNSASALQPALFKTAEGTRVQGMVCRAPATVATQRGQLQLQHLNAAGKVVDTTSARLSESLNRRNRTCDTYNIQTSWTVAATDTVKVIKTN